MKGKTDKNYKENSKLNRKEENLNSWTKDMLGEFSPIKDDIMTSNFYFYI